MSWTLLLPAVAVVTIGVCAGPVQRRLRPWVAVPVLALVGAVAAVAVIGALSLVAFGFLIRVPWVSAWTGWCRRLYGTHQIPAWQGTLAVAGLLAMAVSALVAHRSRRAAIAHHQFAGPLDVVDTEEPIAYAVPGAPGHVVVSSGMLRCLEPSERRVLLAHEQSHLEHRHDRYIALVELVAATVPVLRPLADHVRFATERWADEDAAAQLGDRRLVARAIARAALAQADWRPQRVLALAGLGVPARVEALLEERRPAAMVADAAATAGGAALAVSVGSSAVQLHHLVAFAAHVCRV